MQVILTYLLEERLRGELLARCMRFSPNFKVILNEQMYDDVNQVVCR